MKVVPFVQHIQMYQSISVSLIKTQLIQAFQSEVQFQ